MSEVVRNRSQIEVFQVNSHQAEILSSSSQIFTMKKVRFGQKLVKMNAKSSMRIPYLVTGSLKKLHNLSTLTVNYQKKLLHSIQILYSKVKLKFHCKRNEDLHKTFLANCHSINSLENPFNC